MGITHVTTRVRSLDCAGTAYESDFLVDTGAIACLAPASALKQAGVAEEGRGTYELADGQVVELAYGYARIAFMDCEAVSKIIFGPEDTEPLLGVLALEDAGFAVDPVTRTLKRLEAQSLKRVA